VGVLAHSGHAAHLWQPEWPIVPILLFALLYAIGWHKRASSRGGAGAEAAFFAAGIGALVLALASPLAALDDELFWAHMAQHVLLLVGAPPLLLLGRPWPTVWRSIPLPFRRAAVHGVLRFASRRWVKAAWVVLTAPVFALLLFLGTLAVWHLPVLFDATLRSPAVHILEHVTFFAGGLLLWSHLVDSPPVRSRLGYPARALYATVATGAGWLLAIVIALASEPLYEGYESLASRPGSISALADQHLAAGIMWVPGSLPFTIAILFFASWWLEEAARERRRPASGAAGGR
jgi:cytochrome c oxidase assembly factor CtaG